jgi:hypothetical protein
MRWLRLIMACLLLLSLMPAAPGRAASLPASHAATAHSAATPCGHASKTADKQQPAHPCCAWGTCLTAAVLDAPQFLPTPAFSQARFLPAVSELLRGRSVAPETGPPRHRG